MAKWLLVLVLCLFSVQSTAAQSYHDQQNRIEGEYYDTQGYNNEQCNQQYRSVVGYDDYGSPTYGYFQDCRFQHWLWWYGNAEGYTWAYSQDARRWMWQKKSERRTWWYFTWLEYTKRVG